MIYHTSLLERVPDFMQSLASSFDPEILDSVRAHINSIPRIESHYLKANTKKEFIDGGLGVAERHREAKWIATAKPVQRRTMTVI